MITPLAVLIHGIQSFAELLDLRGRPCDLLVKARVLGPRLCELGLLACEDRVRSVACAQSIVQLLP